MNPIFSTRNDRKEEPCTGRPVATCFLPLRFSLQYLFVGCWVMAAIVAGTIYNSRATFPPWFCPVAVLGLALFLAIIACYFWMIHQVEMPPRPPGTKQAVGLWTLLVLSVICTSSLHGFAPFHLHILTEYPQLPSSLRFIRYNYILTGCSLLAILSLAACFFRGYQRGALAGLVFLAGVMLIPNDDCTNAFNHPWLGWLGASPLMFLGNAVVLLIGYCGLNGLRPRLSAMMMGLIACGVLLLGLGHQSKLIW
jgi:hypothetical protein